MSQLNFPIANSDGRTFRENVNAALQALGSFYYGANDPVTLGYSIAGAFWADSGNNLLKQRNANNTAWITKGKLLSDGTIQLAADAIGFTPAGNISSTNVQSAIAELANRVNSGAAFPTVNLVQGMLFFRTDLKQLFELEDLTPSWVLVFDLNKTATNKEYVDAACNDDVAGGLIDRLNTVMCVYAQPTLAGNNVTLVTPGIALYNMLTGKYAWVREGTYTLGSYKMLGVSWDFVTNYGSGAGQGIVPVVYDSAVPTTRPHKNIIPLCWQDGDNHLYLASNWQFPPFAP